MKNLFLSWFAFFAVAFSFPSCSYITGSHKFNDDRLASRQDGLDLFVKARNGETMTFSKLTVSGSNAEGNFLIGDGKKVNIKFEDIVAFQTNTTYYKRLFATIVPYTGKPWFYYYFGERLRKGKINLYTISEASGASQAKTTTYHTATQNVGAYTTSTPSANSAYKTGVFLQRGDGSIERLSPELLKDLISDNLLAELNFKKVGQKMKCSCLS